MSDPREKLGFTVESSITGPYELQAASPSSPDAGGTLDVGIVAHTTDGRRVVIGEVWAASVGAEDSKIRIDARAIAQSIVDQLNVNYIIQQEESST